LIMLPSTSLPTLIPAFQSLFQGMEGSYSYSSPMEEVTETATSSTAPMEPTMTAARRSPRRERSGEVDARRAALSLSSPVSCHRKTMIHPVREAPAAPPTAPNTGIGRSSLFLMTKKQVATETTATERIANGTGG